MHYLTLGEAEDEVGVTKSTISRAIKAGRLAATRNDHGHYQIDPAELFRVYPAKPRNSDNEVERNTTQQAVQQDATPQNTPNQAATVQWMMKRLDDVENKLAETEHELEVKENAYEELKEIYSALPSPESFDAKLAEEVERLENEKAEALLQKQKAHETVLDQERTQAAKQMTEAKQQSEQWKEEIARRQSEIEQAREASEALRKQSEEEHQKAEALAKKLQALESRGLIARLLNRKLVVG